jgi:3-oxoacid CoA-transferase subunit B
MASEVTASVQGSVATIEFSRPPANFFSRDLRRLPGKLIKGMGGAMELVHGAKRVSVLTEHTAHEGLPKILRENTPPYTGIAVVDRIITDLAVIDGIADGWVVRELAPGVTIDQLRDTIHAPLQVSEAAMQR